MSKILMTNLCSNDNHLWVNQCNFGAKSLKAIASFNSGITNAEISVVLSPLVDKGEKIKININTDKHMACA